MPKISKEARIKKIEAIHPNKFTFDCLEDFVPKDKKYTITCPTHGNFRKTMSNLISNSSGCPSCGNSRKGITNKGTTESFVEKANQVHNSKYTYENVEYVDSHTPVKVTCNTHGIFLVKPYVHLAGHSCRKCAYEDNSIANRMSVNNKPTYLYYVKFTDYDIWKIGCSVNIEHRFHNIPYELLFSKKYEDSRVAYFIEAWLLKSTANLLYKGNNSPIEKGRTELRNSSIDVERLILEAEGNCELLYAK